MPAKNQLETDVLKALAVIAVIFIHVTSAHLFTLDQAGTWQANLNLFFNQTYRFSVPLFVALSGYGLAKKYLTQNLDLKDFFLRRATKILPWYFFASLLIFLAVNFIFTYDKGMYASLPLWKIFLLGHADYDLYFVPMIFQFYLLFPLLFIVFKKFPRLTLGLALLWQIGLYLNISQHTEITHKYINDWPDQVQYFWFYSWLFYFVLGMFLAKNPELKRWGLISIIFLVVGLVWSEFNMFNLLNAAIDPITATRFTRLPVLLYSTGFILVGLSMAPHLLAYLSTRLLGLLSYLGRISYQTYLLHTLVIRALLTHFILDKSIPLVVSSLVVTIVSFLFAYVLTATASLRLFRS